MEQAVRTDPRLRNKAALASSGVSTPTGGSPAGIASPTPTTSAAASAGPGENGATESGAGEGAVGENGQTVISVGEYTPIDCEMLGADAVATQVKAEPTDDPAPLPLRLSSEQIESGMFDTPPPSRNLAADLNAAPIPAASTSTNPLPIPTASSSNPLSRVAQLTKRIEANPLDGEARLALIVDAESKGDLERTREIYEDFLKVFPDASTQWIAYASLELSHSHFPLVEAIFARCLIPSPSIPLWKFYLDYIRRVNPIDESSTGGGAEARGVIGKSFEFALAHVGMDREAGELWKEYIGFLRAGENRGNWEDQQRMDVLRKAYQRAICIPLNNVESIWQEYNQFENGLNKMTAKKFVAELSPSYMTARKVLRELRAQYDILPSLPIPRRPDFSSSKGGDRESLETWKKYLEYEQGNPLDLEEAEELRMRVGLAFRKALGALRFFSEIWFLASNYYTSVGQIEESAELLRAGMIANPSSLLLAYTLAEHEESQGNFPTCYSIYDTLLAHFSSNLAGITTAIGQEINVAHLAIDAQHAPSTTGGEESKPSVSENAGEDVESRQKVLWMKEEIAEKIRGGRKAEMDSGIRAAANVWITEMRFARRAEGIKQARFVFTKARKSPYLAWQVIEASATMELYWNKDVKIATNVFELGLKTFGSEPEYVMQYLDFLIKSNNDSNARALFERSVAKIEPAVAKPLWDRWVQYEYQYGDFSSAQKLFARYSEVFPDVSPIERFAKRHAYLGLDDAITLDLGTAYLPSSSSRQSQQEDESTRQYGAGKRPSSPDAPFPINPPMSLERGTYTGRAQPPPGGPPGPPVGGDEFANKRLKQFHRDSASPAPSAGSRDGWNRAPLPPPGPPTAGGGGGGGGDDYDYSRSGRRRPLEGPVGDRPIPFALDARGEVLAVLPPAVVFFLSILPAANSFNGPILNPATIVEVIGSTILPGSVGGAGAGGYQGERLGVPPRSKGPTSYDQPMRGTSPSRRDDRDYGYGARGGGGGGGQYGGGGGGGGRRY